jgi:hypothetical protein
MRGAVVAGLVALGSAAGIGRVQHGLATEVHEVKQRDDVYWLPPPNELRTMTLGYHGASADAVWAKLIVEYGTHWAEKRDFTEGPRYLEAILALEPAYPLVYRYADTLLCFRPLRGTEQDWYTAKGFLERGTRERPSDHEVWLHYGQFLAFTSLTFVSDKKALEKFRVEGARAIMHAVELGADVDRSVSAATILSKFGERDEAVRRLARKMALTDDPQEREELARKLDQLEASAEREAREHDMRVIEERWRSEYSFQKRDGYLLLGPITSPLACAGRGASERPECPRDWNAALASPAR